MGRIDDPPSALDRLGTIDAEATQHLREPAWAQKLFGQASAIVRHRQQPHTSGEGSAQPR
jgi:hypothetical protein